MENCDKHAVYNYRYVRHQNVAWAHSDIKLAELSLNHLRLMQPMVTGLQMNYKAANILV